MNLSGWAVSRSPDPGQLLRHHIPHSPLCHDIPGVPCKLLCDRSHKYPTTEDTACPDRNYRSCRRLTFANTVCLYWSHPQRQETTQNTPPTTAYPRLSGNDNVHNHTRHDIKRGGYQRNTPIQTMKLAERGPWYTTTGQMPQLNSRDWELPSKPTPGREGWPPEGL